jgi:hypothetical protein
VDRDTGDIVHLGGEFTWGNCEHVATIFSELIERGILPRDGDYGDGLVAQIAWISDGAAWFKERVLPLLGPTVVTILDAYHVLERAGEYAAAAFKEPQQAAAWYSRFRTLLVHGEFVSDESCDVETGACPASVSAPSSPEAAPQRAPRKGHKKTKQRPGAAEEAIRKRAARAAASTATSVEGIVDMLTEPHGQKAQDAHERFCGYLDDHAERIEYLAFRERGLQIGSGAMESIHKSGSQIRLKRPGITCLPRTSQALLNWRMLRLAGRWEEFWDQPALEHKVAATWDECGNAGDLLNAA